MAHRSAGWDRSASLDGRVALVTGGGRGLGASIAEALLAAGATVVVNALTERFLGPLVDRLATSHGGRVHGVAGDIACPRGASEIVAATIRLGGPVDMLINGVGDALQRDLAPSDDEGADLKAIDMLLDLNLKSAIYCTRAAAPGLMASGRGRVINLASVIGGLHGEAHLSVYAAAKAALIGFTRSLAREWAPYAITVNAVAPGIFPDMEAMSPAQRLAAEQAFLDRIPLGRLGRPEEVGHLAAFLASDQAAYVTGQIIACDGGLSA